ncbi:hypothetical protein [Leucobacter tenebrionis]|uniref:hypothetical protein n=1 Tax=Leucobacter tenebrionis TaxID=2873270 RepID=UPI001CA7A8E9|nr:hypothetical protein [Leucobacter tenebrionis]QZY52260.1 hypothetical protein KVY00_01960 [Leucobacter tenebrionis]
MRAIIKKKSIAIAAAGAAVLLALTGCSGAQPGDGSRAAPDNGAPSDAQTGGAGTWDFTSVEAMSQKQSITFTIPDDLASTVPGYEEERLFSSVTITGLVVEDDPSRCAARLDFEPAPGVDLVGMMNERAAKLNAEPNRSSGPATTAEPAGLLYGAVGGDSRFVPQIGEPDFENPSETGLWLSEDFTRLTQFTRCAAQPFDPDVEGVEVVLPYLKTEKHIYPLSVANVSVMKNGDLAVLSAEVRDFRLDSTGTWIAD